MPNDITGSPTPQPHDAPRRGALQWLREFDHGLDLVKGLSIVTVLSSAVVGYFQYLNNYQEKISNQAKEDMASAAATFSEISGAFSEIQALQRILYSDFTHAVRDKSDGSDQALVTRNAQAVSEIYEKAWTTLAKSAEVLSRKAEVYIDWASDSYRDPADKRNVDDDPLSLELLRDYAFDCSQELSFPAFGNVNAKETQPGPDIPDDAYCASGTRIGVYDTTLPKDAFVRICSPEKDKHAKRIYWFSAKHNVLTMNYCFEAAHNRLAAARQWASKSHRDTVKEGEIAKADKEISAQLDGLLRRLNAFNSLALYQMEKIRVKYRPLGALCSVPLIRQLSDLNCFPLRTATRASN
jgi:hypothetical protein